MDPKEPSKPEALVQAPASLHAHNALAASVALQRAIIDDYERSLGVLRAQLAMERTRAARLEGELAGARKALEAWRAVMEDDATPAPNPGVRKDEGG